MQDMTALLGNITGKVRKETCKHLRWPLILDRYKAHLCQLAAELVRLKVSNESFAKFCYLCSTSLVSDTHFRRERRRWIAVVEHYMRTTSQASDETKGRPHSWLGQVRDNSKPTKERLLFGIEARRRQTISRVSRSKSTGT